MFNIDDNKKYDIIIASAVLEHLPSPNKEIEKLFSLLANNGAMYCRTPYMFPIYCFCKKIGIDYDTLYPGHIWDLGDEWHNNLPKIFKCDKEIKVEISRPSIVEKNI